MAIRSIINFTQNSGLRFFGLSIDRTKGVKRALTTPAHTSAIFQKNIQPFYQSGTTISLKSCKQFVNDFIPKRQLYSARSKAIYTPEKYLQLSDNEKIGLNLLLGIQFMWEKLDPRKPAPEKLDNETWANFISLVKKHEKLFSNLPSFKKKALSDWSTEKKEIEEALDSTAVHIFSLGPFPIFHPNEYKNPGILYSDLNDKKWGIDALTGIADLSYEKLYEDQKKICDLSVEQIQSGETLCDICCWNGNSLLTAALKALQMKKEIYLMGINLTIRGLVKSLLTARAIGLDNRLTIGFGNVIYPLTLPIGPEVIMNSHLLSVLSGEKAQTFLQGNLNPLLQPANNVAFLSASVREGKAYEEFEEEFNKARSLSWQARHIERQSAYMQTGNGEKQEIGVTFLQKNPEYGNAFTISQTYYTMQGLERLMLQTKIKIEEIYPVVTDQRQHRVILKLRHLRT